MTTDFQKNEAIVYTQTYANGKKVSVYDAEFIQPSRNREGCAVIIVHAAGQKYRAIVPLRDLRKRVTT